MSQGYSEAETENVASLSEFPLRRKVGHKTSKYIYKSVQGTTSILSKSYNPTKSTKVNGFKRVEFSLG